MVAPATFQIAEQFGIGSEVEMAMVTSVFVLAYGECTKFRYRAVCRDEVVLIKTLCSRRSTVFGPAIGAVWSLTRAAAGERVLPRYA
jgi:hypothetical protein